MPELPEVETTLRGIQNHILHKEIKEIKVRQPYLRWQVPTELIVKSLEGNSFSEIHRRAKYLVLKSQKGSLLIHSKTLPSKVFHYSNAEDENKIHNL